MEGHDLKDYLTFRRMVTPILIQVVFWAIAGAVLVAAVLGASFLPDLGGIGAGNDVAAFIIAIVVAIFILLAVRVYAEILIVAFKINDSLTDISNTLAEIKNQGARGASSFGSRPQAPTPRREASGPRPETLINPPVGGGGTKTCPYCAESIMLAEIRCRYCGSDVSNEPSS